MKAFNVLLSGLGGQGVVLASRLLLEEALLRGSPARGAETHGMAQRGGPVVAHVRLGPCFSPLVLPGTGDLLLGFERQEGLRSVRLLRSGATLVVNSRPPATAGDVPGASAGSMPWPDNVKVVGLDATGIAAGLGNPRAVNLVLLGFASTLVATPFELERLRVAVARLMPARAEEMVRALEAGHHAGEPLRA